MVYSCEVRSADIYCASVADVCERVGLVVAL